MTDMLIDVMKDDRFSSLSVHELKVMRANMINQGGYSKFEFALVQFWIMKKENRLDQAGIK